VNYWTNPYCVDYLVWIMEQQSRWPSQYGSDDSRGD